MFDQFYTPTIQQGKINQKKIEDEELLSPLQLFVCFEQKKKMMIPLRNINYHLKIHKGLQIVELEQIYSTETFNDLLDLEYVFSINENAAVTKMKVELGEKTVYGIIKEKEEAKQEFDEGIQQGKTMAYSEEDINFPQIKRLKIGQLGPKQKLKVIFEYIQPLEVFLNKFWKIDLSPIIDQNYQKNKDNVKTGYKKIFKYLNNIFNIKNFTFNYKQDIEIVLETGSPITYWKSPTHSLHSTNAKDNEVKQQENCNKLVLKLDDIPENYNPQKKFSLLFSSDDINIPRAVLSHTNNDALFAQKYCATLTFIPQFNQIPLDDAYIQYMDGINIPLNQVVNRGNYLFIIDRSGSMDNSRINKAKQSLILFLRSLPQNSLFNIISFGSKYQSLWEESKQYTQDTLQEAIRHVQSMTANMGGTEIYKPLKEMIYNSNYGSSNDTTLNVFLLTDGEDNADPIIKLVKDNNKAETRIYTLGIGEDCSYYLIKRVAEVGNGKFHLVGEDEDINEKVIDLLEDSLTPYLKDFKLETNASAIFSIIPNPESIISLKKNQELTIQILFSEQDQKDIEFSIHCFDSQDQKPIKYSVNLNLNQSQQNEYFHKLAAHKFITYYENALRYGQQQVNFIKLNKQNLEDKDIVNLSIENQILSNKTAFVCEVCELEDQLKQQIRSKITIKNPTVNQRQYEFEESFNRFKLMNQQFNSYGASYQFMGMPTQCAFDHCQMAKCSSPQILQCQSSKKSDQNLFSQQFQGSSIGFQMATPPKMDQYSMSCSMQQNMMPSFQQCSFQASNNSQFGLAQQFKAQNKQTKPTFENLFEFLQADGSFKISDDMKVRVNFLNLSNSEGFNDDIWNTFLILLYLEKFCSESKKQWQLVFSKGVLYLNQNGINYTQKKQELDNPQE